MQEGIPRSSFPFHFHSVSGPQPYIVIAPELNACPSSQDMIHNSFPDSFRHFVWPFLGFSSFGQTTKKGEICFKVYISWEKCGMCRTQIDCPEAPVISQQFFLKGHVNPKIHVFLILCKKWRRKRIWNSFCPIRLILGENRHFQLKFHFR